MSKNILVIGGAGYIGSHMVRALLDEKHNPIVFDNLSTGHKGFIPEGAIFIQGDLHNIQACKQRLRTLFSGCRNALCGVKCCAGVHA